MQPNYFPILIVDDMPAVRAIVREMLECLGFRHFDEAEDGDMAWRMIQASSGRKDARFRLIVSDWLMPGLDGIDLVQRVRQNVNTADVPFLMITSQSERERWRQAQDAGVTGFVVKPFDHQQLREQLSRIFPEYPPIAAAGPKRGKAPV